MDTLTILTSIGTIFTACATILTAICSAREDICTCLGTMCGKKKEDGWMQAVAHGMEPDEMNPPQSSSSLRNVSRDSLVKLQQKEIFYKVEGSLMTLLRNCLELDTKNSVSILSWHVDHYHSIKSEDAALGWGCGCGLRNIQMLSSHLLSQRQEAREALYGGSGFVPNIAALQRWIELAWEKGFGPTHDYDRRFYGNKSWIGARDCAALLRYFGLRANVVDFKISSEKGNHVVTKWVWDYFSDRKVNRSGDDRRVILSEKAPLYFHTDGHSRTIVGIQATRESNGMNLLIFEPAIKTKSLEESLRKNVGWQQLIKRSSHTLKEPVYQLCYVDPGIAYGKELENLKTIKSIRLEF